MKPITFACEGAILLAPEDIAQQILDLSQWPDFQGYGPIPGIKVAEFEVQTPGMVGSRIWVTNTAGSSHIEEIVEWEHDCRLRLHMHEFSAPLSRLAADFVESWKFQPVGNETRVIRSFQLHAKSILAWPVLWMISFFLLRAIVRHLRQLKNVP